MRSNVDLPQPFAVNAMRTGPLADHVIASASPAMRHGRCARSSVNSWRRADLGARQRHEHGRIGFDASGRFLHAFVDRRLQFVLVAPHQAHDAARRPLRLCFAPDDRLAVFASRSAAAC